MATSSSSNFQNREFENQSRFHELHQRFLEAEADVTAGLAIAADGGVQRMKGVEQFRYGRDKEAKENILNGIQKEAIGLSTAVEGNSDKLEALADMWGLPLPASPITPPVPPSSPVKFQQDKASDDGDDRKFGLWKQFTAAAFPDSSSLLEAYRNRPSDNVDEYMRPHFENFAHGVAVEGENLGKALGPKTDVTGIVCKIIEPMEGALAKEYTQWDCKTNPPTRKKEPARYGACLGMSILEEGFKIAESTIGCKS